jgi:hypothetical protein
VKCSVHILRGLWHRLFHIQVKGKSESRESQSVRKAFMGQIDAERHHFTQGPTHIAIQVVEFSNKGYNIRKVFA